MLDYEAEELSATEPSDRAFWETQRGSLSTLRLTDEFPLLIQQVTNDQKIQLKYNKHYIGLARGGLADNFVLFNPRRQHLQVGFKLALSEELVARVEDAGLDLLEYNKVSNRFRLKIFPGDVEKH